MRWHVVKNGQKLGPYTVAELVEQMATGSISLDVTVIKEGSPVRRKLVNVPEIVQALAQVSTANPKNVAAEQVDVRSTRQVALQPNHRMAQTISAERKVAPPESRERARHGETVHAPAARVGIAQSLRHDAARSEPSALDSPAQSSEFPGHESTNSLSLQEARRRAQEILAERQAKKDAVVSDVTVPAFDLNDPDSLAKGNRSGVPFALLNESERKSSEEEGRGKGSEGKAPHSYFGPPSHQLPLVESEANLRVRKRHSGARLGWQRDRVNSTSIRAVKELQQEARVRQRRRSLKDVNQFFVVAGFSLVVGTLLVVGLLLVLHRKDPRLAPTKGKTAETPTALKSGGESPVPQVAPQPTSSSPPVTSQAQSPAKGLERNEKAAEKSPKPERDDRPSRRKGPDVAAKKAQRETQASKESPGTLPVDEGGGRESSPKETAKESEGEDKGNKAGAKGLPTDWPTPPLTTGSALKAKSFQTVSIDNVLVPYIPPSCGPCRIFGQLSDGSSVVFVSTSVGPWATARGAGTKRFAIKGFVQRNPEGEISVLVQAVVPK